MNIITIFEELAKTAHHKVNFNGLLQDEVIELQQMFANNDATSLKALFNEKAILADRNTIFEL